MKSSKTKMLSGPSRELFADGGLSGEGRMKNGKRHGNWKFYYRSGGMKAKGKYADGQLDGYWEWWRENGQLLQHGAFKRGVQIGPWKRYYDNGQLWDEGAYSAAGRKVGEWKVYEKSGTLKGGILCSFIDDAFGTLCFASLRKPCVSIDMTVNFIRPAKPGACSAARA